MAEYSMEKRVSPAEAGKSDRKLPLLRIENLKKYYPQNTPIFWPSHILCPGGRRRFAGTVSGGDSGPGRRVRLWEIHAGPPDRGPGAAGFRPDLV